ncbi:hypothetical protein Tco_0941856 [Tanacetum coccineum]|uniref:Uncharacterized protein n=1 Tax=Tanacetum coccineum TaxID=301880 RepID=A0ABQ5DS33_9ASTR
MFRPSATASDDPAISVQVLLPFLHSSCFGIALLYLFDYESILETRPVQRFTVASEPKVRLKRRKEEVGCVKNKQIINAVKEKAIEAIMRYCDSLYFKENTIEEKLNGCVRKFATGYWGDKRLAQEDQEAVKECYKEYIGMVKICYEGTQRSKQERPGEDVVISHNFVAVIFTVQEAKGHRRTSNTKMQNHGPQETPDFRFSKKTRRQNTAKVHFDTGSTSRRPDFILDAVLDPKPMALPPPSLNPATPTHTFVSRNDKNQR